MTIQITIHTDAPNKVTGIIDSLTWSGLDYDVHWVTHDDSSTIAQRLQELIDHDVEAVKNVKRDPKRRKTTDARKVKAEPIEVTLDRATKKFLDWNKIISHPCPKCGAKQHESCLQRNGRRYGPSYTHRARRDAYRYGEAI